MIQLPNSVSAGPARLPMVARRVATALVSAALVGAALVLVPAGPAAARTVMTQSSPVTITLPAYVYAYSHSTNIAYPSPDALVGRHTQDGSLYRSHFGFLTGSGGQTYRGGTILSATFSVLLTHSWSCQPTPVTLHRTGTITVGNGQMLPWSTPAPMLPVATQYAAANLSCGQPDVYLNFSSPALISDLQAAADAHMPTYAVMLCACSSPGVGENLIDRWKRFEISSAQLSVTYIPATA